MTISISNEDLVFIALAIAKANGHPEPHEWADKVVFNSVDYLPPPPDAIIPSDTTSDIHDTPEHIVE